jgi:four helix bundle protein
MNRVTMETSAKVTFGFETLDVYRCAVEFVVHAYELAAAVPPGQAALADQLRRASTSVVLNIAEGSGRLRDADAARHRAIARGSAMECAAVLDICRALGFARAESLEEARSLLVRVVQMLSRMCK